MIFSGLFTQNSILESSMQASQLRNQVILNNIANDDVPGFKKQIVTFENTLLDAINASRRTGTSLDLAKVQPKVTTIHQNFNYRMDGNNVDMETEMVDLYQNSVRYDTMASAVINNYKRINLVMQMR